MSAEQLIALEAAQAELGTLYVVARTFAALHTRAESELLPYVTGLGSRLRGLLRRALLTNEEIDTAARDILAVRSAWREALEQVRASASYQQALAAFSADRQADLAEVIPRVFVGLRCVHPAPSLYLPVSPSTGRRRAGSSPFLSAAACADRVAALLSEGYVPESGGTEWWECELPAISGNDNAAGLETPIALCVAAPEVPVAVFAAALEPSYRVFTPRLRAPMSIVLAAEATDEWWEAYQDSYRDFRDALRHELVARGHSVSIADA